MGELLDIRTAPERFRLWVLVMLGYRKLESAGYNSQAYFLVDSVPHDENYVRENANHAVVL